jgi:hypothetical protein
VKVQKEANVRMGRNLFLRSKMKTKLSLTNSFSDPKGEVSTLKASFKNLADKIFIWTAMKSRQTAEQRKFFFRKNRFLPMRKFVQKTDKIFFLEFTKSVESKKVKTICKNIIKVFKVIFFLQKSIRN